MSHMAIELTIVLKARNIVPGESAAFAQELENAIGQVLEEERIVAIPAYFVSNSQGTSSFRIGLRFDGISEKLIEATARDVIETALRKLERGDNGAASRAFAHRQPNVKRLSSQLVSA